MNLFAIIQEDGQGGRNPIAVVLQKQVAELKEKTKENEYIIRAKLQEKDSEVQRLKEQMRLMQESQREILALLRDIGDIKTELNATSSMSIYKLKFVMIVSLSL